MNGQIISKFQSVYHYHTGKAVLFWATLYIFVISTVVASFMAFDLIYVLRPFGSTEIYSHSTLPETDENT